MRRREFLSALVGGAAVWPLAAHGQQAGGVRRVGILMGFADIDTYGQESVALIRQVLKDAGWVEGRNVEVLVRWVKPGEDPASSVKEIIAFAPDVILANPTRVVIPLQKETSSIPIVFASVSDPLSQGIVSNLARPGGNITGFSNPPFSLVGKAFQILKEIAPSVARVATIISATNGAAPSYFSVLDSLAQSFALTPIKAAVNSRAEIEDAINLLAREPHGALFVPRDNFTEANRDLLIQLAARHRLPAIYARRSFVAEGGLMSYGGDPDDAYRGAAAYVDRILRGEKAGELPVQEPTKFEFVINLRTAKTLGLTIPIPLLGRADEVIE